MKLSRLSLYFAWVVLFAGCYTRETANQSIPSNQITINNRMVLSTGSFVGLFGDGTKDWIGEENGASQKVTVQHRPTHAELAFFVRKLASESTNAVTSSERDLRVDFAEKMRQQVQGSEPVISFEEIPLRQSYRAKERLERLSFVKSEFGAKIDSKILGKAVPTGCRLFVGCVPSNCTTDRTFLFALFLIPESVSAATRQSIFSVAEDSLRSISLICDHDPNTSR